MSRWVTGFMIVSSLIVSTSAYAQETAPGPGKAEVTFIPGGVTFDTKKGAGPSFGNYDIGGAFAGNFNRIVGVEGELGGSLGVRHVAVLTVDARNRDSHGRRARLHVVNGVCAA